MFKNPLDQHNRQRKFGDIRREIRGQDSESVVEVLTTALPSIHYLQSPSVPGRVARA